MPDLRVTKITSIGAVEAGDNPEAQILLFKSKQEPVSAESVEDRSEEMSKTMDDLDLDADALAVIADHVKAEVEKAVAELTPEPEVDPLAKADDAVKAEIEKRDERIANLEKSVEEQITKARQGQFTELAKTYAPVTGKPDEAAAHLDALEKGAPEAFKWLTDRFKVIKEVVVTSNLLKELGDGTEDGADTQDLINAKVAKIKEGDPKITDSAARAQVWRENPDLVAAAREGR